LVPHVVGAPGPFTQALAGQPLLLAASSAPIEAILLPSTRTRPYQQNSLTASQHGQDTSTHPSRHQTAAKSASATTFEETAPLALIRKTSAPTSAPSAEKTTTPSPGHAAHAQVTDFLAVAKPPPLLYTDFSSTISHRLPTPAISPPDQEIFSRVVHPYSADAFDTSLRKHHLTSNYPLLIQNLREGFPLGRMPRLSHTIIFPNNPSSLSHTQEIDNYLNTEMLAHRMSGPFSREGAERILCGPFQASPLIVSIQPQHPGAPDKIRICHHLSKASKAHVSVNSHIAKEDFPTRFDTASRVAEIVSVLFKYYLFPHFLYYCFADSGYLPLCRKPPECLIRVIRPSHAAEPDPTGSMRRPRIQELPFDLKGTDQASLSDQVHSHQS